MRNLKLLVLFIMRITGIFSIMHFINRKNIRILCYHGIWLGEEGYPGDLIFMNQKTFESRIECLKKWKFNVIPLAEAAKSLSEKRLPAYPVVITIDDGWYSTYKAMFPVLKKHGFPATLYCDTNNLHSDTPVPHVMARYLKLLHDKGYTGAKYLSPDKNQNDLFRVAITPVSDRNERLERVKKYAQSISIDYNYYLDNKIFSYMSHEQLKKAYVSGFDIQLHTHNHSMHDMSETSIIHEIEENRKHLANILGVDTQNFNHFCYPSGVYSDNLCETLDNLGIKSSTTTEPSLVYSGTHHQLLPRIVDGESLSQIEFEAELCGLMDIFRKMKKLKNPATKEPNLVGP
ncbi:MAG: polysaccharide deacetylase family protein [bacterium]